MTPTNWRDKLRALDFGEDMVAFVAQILEEERVNVLKGVLSNVSDETQENVEAALDALTTKE